MAERVASLYAEIGADTRDLQRGMGDAQASIKDTETAIKRFDLAAYNATKAARELSEAEHRLATNTDPQKQDELRGAVLKARVEADKAQASVDKYAKELDSLGKSTVVAKSRQEQISDAYKKFIGIGAAVAGALYTIKKGYDETVGVTVEYNKTMREGSQVTGMAVEEFSRLVQVGDDWGISAESITTALAMMRQKGVQPSLEAVANLADEFIKAGDTTAFAEKAVGTLGRGWKTLVPLLAKGGDALRQQAAAVDDSLIATEKGIQMTRQYELAMDDWNDTILAAKMSIGNDLIPALTSFIKLATGPSADSAADFINTIFAGTIIESGAGRQARAITDFGLALERSAEAQTRFYSGVTMVNAAMQEGEPILYDYVYTFTDADKEASRAAQAVENFAIGVDKTAEAADKAKGPLDDFLDGVDRQITSPIAAFIEDLKWFQAGGGQIEQAFADVQKALAEGKITPDQADAFAKELLVAATDLQLELDQVDAKQAAANLEETLGKAAARIAMQEIKGSEGIQGALDQITGVQYYLDFKFRYTGTPPPGWNGQTTTTTTTTGGTGVDGGGTYGGRKAAGGPVMAGVPYLVGERGPELFTPGQSGGITPNNALGGGDVYADITINAAPGMDTNAIANMVVARLQAASRNQRAGGYARGG